MFFMPFKKNYLDWWRGFLGISHNARRETIQILQQQYREAIQRASHLTQHAENMPYRHFREKLLSIAADETKRSDQMAEKIRLLGGTLPAVPTTELTGGNGWRSLLADLQEQQRSAAELWEHLRRVPAEFPDISELLQRVYEDGKRHRSEILDMVMRSDPQAFSAG
jgi:bacterioferritin (cytochrome b1)